jgi:hypothetical protein
MFNSSNRSDSEVARDPLLQSSLAYWSSGVRPDTEPDPMGWEAERPDLSGITRIAVSLIGLCLAAAALWQLGL